MGWVEGQLSACGTWAYRWRIRVGFFLRDPSLYLRDFRRKRLPRSKEKRAAEEIQSGLVLNDEGPKWDPNIFFKLPIN